MSFPRKVLAVSVLCIFSASGSLGAESLREKEFTADVAKLYSEDANTRASAAKRLMAAGPAVIPALVAVICNPDDQRSQFAWREAAEVLGRLKAAAAASCLAARLMDGFFADKPVLMIPDDRLIREDPAFAALVAIGAPAVPGIRPRIFHLRAEPALLALRVLRIINTPEAKEAGEAYLRFLADQTRFANEIMEGFNTAPQPSTKGQTSSPRAGGRCSGPPGSTVDRA